MSGGKHYDGAGYIIGIDVGGTFTDFVVLDCVAEAFSRKGSLSTPGDESEGVLAAIQSISEREQKEIAALLSETDLVILGTTVATNTIAWEFKGSNTGMITTKGFRDVIELRNNYKESLFNLEADPALPDRSSAQETGRYRKD